MDKPGFKTSEFWMNLILACIGAALMAWGGSMTPPNAVLVSIGGTLTAAAGGMYTMSRTSVKKAANENGKAPEEPQKP